MPHVLRVPETAAGLLDRAIPKRRMRQTLLSVPILCSAASSAVHPELPAPVLQIIHWVFAAHLTRRAGVFGVRIE
jgi:hypothetical protein